MGEGRKEGGWPGEVVEQTLHLSTYMYLWCSIVIDDALKSTPFVSTRIGPGYPVLVLTVYDSLPCHTPPPSTSDVTPLTQLHTHFPLVSTPPSCINRSRSTIQNR